MLLEEGNKHSQTNAANELDSQIGQQGHDTYVQQTNEAVTDASQR